MDQSKIIAEIIDKEKGYVDHPSDRGGPTNYGITQSVARANGFYGDMKDLPKATAELIYSKRYIIEPRFHHIVNISAAVGEELIDTGVNMGPATASIFFQRLLNALNAQGTRYSDLFVDGRIGPATVTAFSSYLKGRGPAGETVMLKALNGIQVARYLEIAEKNKSQEDFFYGWIANRT